MELVGEGNIKYCMVGYRGYGIECIVGEDFNMECGICLEGGKYSFYRVGFGGDGWRQSEDATQ